MALTPVSVPEIVKANGCAARLTEPVLRRWQIGVKQPRRSIRFHPVFGAANAVRLD